MKPVRLLMLLALVAASAAAQEVTTTIVPVAGSVVGAGMVQWKTDVEIINDTAFETDVAIEMPAAPAAPVMILTLAPGQIQRFTDIVGQAFGLPSALSPLRITTAGRRALTVRAHAYPLTGTEPPPMQPIAVFTGDVSYPVRVLDNLAFSNELRTNIGLLNFGDAPAVFVLALQRVPGRNLAVAHVAVDAGGLVHSPIQSIFPLITKGVGFSVVIESSMPLTYVYGSVIESPSHAAEFITPRIGAR